MEVGIWLLLGFFLLLGMPIFVSLGLSTLVFLWGSDTPLGIIPADLAKVTTLYPLLAIPGFIFSGCLMERGDMARRIVRFSSLLVGRISGSTGMITIVGCMLFAAMIGSGPGTVAAMGALMIPAMIREGYEPHFASGLSAAGGTLGILIPPSNPMIIYGVMANVSVTTLFMAGFMPGILGGILLMAVIFFYTKRRRYPRSTQKREKGEVIRIFKESFFSLMAPVIVLGGIYSGIFTAVEASAISVFYALFVGFFINRQLTWKGVKDALRITVMSSGTSNVIIGVSILFGRFLTLEQVPQRVAGALLAVSDNPYLIMGLLVGMLFFLGMFMETLSTIVILTPIFIPVITALGINPVHFGILWIITNQVAMLTPPLGANLFIAMNLSGLSLERVVRGALPFIVALALFTFLIMFFPEISLLVPKLFGAKV